MKNVLSAFLISVTLIFASCQRNSMLNENSDNLNLTMLNLNTKISDSLKSNLKTFHGPGIILRIHEYDCSACIDFELENLNKLPEYLKNRTLLLTAFKNQRALNVLLSKHKIKNSVINYFGEIPIMLEKIGKPYYFLIAQNGDISNFHVSKIEDISSTSAYYGEIKEIIVQNDSVPHSSSTFRIDKSSFDLGNIEINSTQKVDFVLENLSNRPLMIENIIATCGCTSVEWERIPIKPLGKTKIIVTYNAMAKGYFFKKIMILLSGDAGIQVLSIKGEVIGILNKEIKRSSV